MTDTQTEDAPYVPWTPTLERRSPWAVLADDHQLLGPSGGEVDAMTAEAVLKQTGLDKIFVQKFPVSIDRSRERDGTKMVRVEKLFVTGYEIDNDVTAFGTVSDKYEIVQPLESLAMFDEIIQRVGGAHYVCGWNMPEKARMGVTIKMPDPIIIDPSGAADQIDLYMLGVNSFDGSTSLMGMPIPERLFCTNQLTSTMAANKRRGFCFKHTRNVQTHAKDAQRILANTWDYLKVFETQANRLAGRKMTQAQFEKFLAKLIPFEVKDDMGDLKKERTQQFRQEAVAAWNAPHNENITGTEWAAYNVVVEFSQWGRRVQGSARTGTSPQRQRAIGTMVHPDPETWSRQALELLAA